MHTTRSFRRGPHRAARRRGFSVIEVIVSIVLLGISLSTLGVLAFQASRRNMVVANAAYRSAAMRYLFDRYSALDFDAIDASQALDSTLSTGPLPLRMQAQMITTTTPNEKRIRLIVTPTNRLILPETTLVRRFRWASTNPLNTGI